MPKMLQILKHFALSFCQAYTFFVYIECFQFFHIVKYYYLFVLVFSGLKRMTSSCSILQEVLICRTLLEDNTFGQNNPGNSSAGQL